MKTKAEKQADLGRLYYRALTDAQGYPNGMAYWPEMTADEQYFYAMTGLQFLEMAFEYGVTAEDAKIDGGYHDPDCQAVKAELDKRKPAEKKQFQDKIDEVRAALGQPPEGDDE